MNKLFTSAALTIASLATAFTLAAAPASASVSHFGPTGVVAVTHVTSRPDSGGNGDWANDSFTRTLTIKKLGSTDAANCGTGNTAPCFAFTATLSDGGFGARFTTIPGAYTPNQGVSPGSHLPNHSLTGRMSGTGQFGTFYSTSQPDASLVPHFSAGSANPSSTWPALAFPATATLESLSENTFDYNYSAVVHSVKTIKKVEHVHVWVFTHHHWVRKTVTRVVTFKVPVTTVQHWNDSNPLDGQGAGPGNITG